MVTTGIIVWGEEGKAGEREGVPSTVGVVFKKRFLHKILDIMCFFPNNVVEQG